MNVMSTKREDMSEAVDVFLPILKRIQEDTTAVKVSVSMIPEMAQDIQKLVSKVGQALELEKRVRRIESHLHLEL